MTRFDKLLAALLALITLAFAFQWGPRLVTADDIGQSLAGGNYTIRLLRFASTFVVVIGLWRVRHRWREAKSVILPLLAIALVLLLNAYLSELRALSLRRSGAMAAYLASAVVFALLPKTPSEAERLFDLVVALFAASCVASLALLFLDPEFAAPRGRLVGIFRFPVNTGSIAGVAILSIAIGGVRRGKHRMKGILWVSAAAASFVVLALSEARSVIVSLSVALVFFALFMTSRKLRVAKVCLALASGVLLFLGAHQLTGILEHMGSIWTHSQQYSPLEELATLTGRRYLWEAVLYVQPPQMVGSGYGTFWAGWQGEAVAGMFGAFRTGGAHNTWLDILSELGIIGLASVLFLAVAMGLDFRQALSSKDDKLRSLGQYALLLSVFFLTQSIVESVFTNSGPFLWLMIALAVICARFSGGHHFHRRLLSRSRSPQKPLDAHGLEGENSV